MRILFLSNKDLASNYALNMLLPKVSKHHETHLWLSAKVGNTKEVPKQLKTLKYFEQELFDMLLSPLIAASKNPLACRAFSDFNDFLHSDLKEVNKINSAESVQALTSLAPDLIVSIRYGGIMKDLVINIPPKGVINLHSGILPKYKGVMATFWALKNHDEEIGTTLHTIDDGTIDTGQIIKISKIKKTASKSYLWHVLTLYKQGSKDILEAIETLNKGGLLMSLPQEKSDTYFTFPTETECVEFEQQGFEIVNKQEYLTFISDHYL